VRLHSRYFIFVLGFNLLSSFGFAKANFPARGFAPVLDVEQAWVFIRAIPTFAYFSHRPNYQFSGLKSFVFFFIDPRS